MQTKKWLRSGADSLGSTKASEIEANEMGSGKDGGNNGEEDDDHFEGDVDELRTKQKLNPVATISALRRQPHSWSWFNMPLCRLLAKSMVWPKLQSDLSKLEQGFIHGYWGGASMFFVTTINEEGKNMFVTNALKEIWGDMWN